MYYSPITRNNVTLTFAGETDESQDNIIPYSWSPGRDLNHGSPSYSAES
jgi:hypothetical protein